jgi:hypothetical protein
MANASLHNDNRAMKQNKSFAALSFLVILGVGAALAYAQ